MPRKEGYDVHIYLDAEHKGRLDACRAALRDREGSCNRLATGATKVVTEAIDMYWAYTVMGESHVHPEDTRRAALVPLEKAVE